MNVKTHLVALMALLFLAGCASGPPKPTVDFKQDYDFSGVKKVAMFHESGHVSGENPIQVSDMARNRVDIALKQALEKKGFQWVENPVEADLLVSWHLATQQKTDVRSYPSAPMYGYGPYNRYSMYSCWGCAGMGYGNDISVQNYTEGTFIVDMIDPGLKQSVWRGVTHSRLKDKPNQDQASYNAAADVLFASFPPGSIPTGG